MPEFLTPEQQENCKAALTILEAAPAERIGLSRYITDCGTMFCSMGELCNSSYFKEKGWVWDGVCPVLSFERAGRWLDCPSTATIAFGVGAYDSLFKGRSSGEIDDMLIDHDLARYRALTDKDLAVLRMRLWLECDGNLRNLNLKDF